MRVKKSVYDMERNQCYLPEYELVSHIRPLIFNNFLENFYYFKYSKGLLMEKNNLS